MINKLSIRNFKCLRNVEVDLQRFTVFVGPNGSGKSSLLQALEVLCRSFTGQMADVDAELLPALCRGCNEHVEVAAEVGGKAYRCRSRPSSPSGSPPVVGRPGQRWSGEGCGVGDRLDSTDWSAWVASQTQASPLPLAMLLRLEYTQLIFQGLVAPNEAGMMPNGHGVHAALANMALNDPDSWQQL